jgi:hypothetical protein
MTSRPWRRSQRANGEKADSRQGHALNWLHDHAAMQAGGPPFQASMS